MKTKTRDTLVLSGNAWHVKVYQFWRRYAHLKKRNYQENLCHYWRCVVFWAPMHAIVSYEIADIEWLRPIFILMALFGTSAFAAALVLWPVKVLTIIGFVIVGLAALAALLLFLDKHEEKSFKVGPSKSWARKWLWSWFQYVARPIAWVAVKAFNGVLDLAGSIIELLEPATWAIILVGFFVVFAVTLLVIAAIQAPWIVLASVLGLLLLLGLAVGLALLVERLHDRPKKVKVETGPGMARVSYEYLVSRKHRICPFIKIDS